MRHRAITRVLVGIEERIQVYRRKIEVHEERKNFRTTNDMYELNRRMFHRKLHGGPRPEGVQTKEEMVEFWARICEQSDSKEDLSDLIEQRGLVVERNGYEEIAAASEKVRVILKGVSNWKTPGCTRCTTSLSRSVRPCTRR